MQDERPNWQRNEDDTKKEIDRFKDLIRKLSQVPIEEVREERRKPDGGDRCRSQCRPLPALPDRVERDHPATRDEHDAL